MDSNRKYNIEILSGLSVTKTGYGMIMTDKLHWRQYNMATDRGE